MQGGEYIHAKTVKEAERNLEDLIKRCGLEKRITLAQVREEVLSDDGDDAKAANDRYFAKIFKVIRDVPEESHNDAIQAFMDAWNFFPHKVLGGKSPMEMLEEAKARGEAPEFIGGFSPVEIFAELYRLPRERAKREHARLGGKPHEFARFENMLAKIENADDETHASIFITMHGLELLRRSHADMPEAIELFMRETQAMLNHRFWDTKEASGSILLWHAMDTLEQDGLSAEDLNVPRFMTTLLEAHHAVDSFAQTHALDHRANSVAHHILDWMAMETPERFETLAARRLTALAYGIAGRAHEAVMGSPGPTGTQEQLMRLGGWRLRRSFGKALEEAFLDVVYAVQDPHMLLLEANAPDDWFARLKRIAPELESENDDSGRPPPGSVVSPYL